MPLLGRAAVAMWWDMAAAMRAEFEDWHSHEHFPERLRIPGFLRGSRWAAKDDDPGFFVMYELDVEATLTSPHYLARLNNPTPWSTKMMPHHGNMVRSLCQVAQSHGGGIASFMLTLRLSPEPDRLDALTQHLHRALAAAPQRPGITGGHLLHTRIPEAPPTEEQKIRGGADRAADWIVLVSGCDEAALSDFASEQLSTVRLAAAGAGPAPIRAYYSLSHAATPGDF